MSWSSGNRRESHREEGRRAGGNDREHGRVDHRGREEQSHRRIEEERPRRDYDDKRRDRVCRLCVPGVKLLGQCSDQY